MAYKGAGDLANARQEAQRAADMATLQIGNGPDGPLICGGCPSQGKNLTECQECLQLSQELLRDIEVVDGNYRI